MEYFGSLQTATNTNYIYLCADDFGTGSDFLQQAMPSEEMEYANITQKSGIPKLQPLVGLPPTVGLR